MDDRALIDASVANIVAAYEAVARHAAWPVTGASRTFGRAIAVVTGHPTVGFWNPVVACLPGTDPDDVLAAHAWIDAQELPCTVHLGPGDPSPALAGDGSPGRGGPCTAARRHPARRRCVPGRARALVPERAGGP